MIHGLAALVFLIDLDSILAICFHLNIQFESFYIRILVFVVIPLFFIPIKVCLIDRFFDTFSYKIKWIYDIIIFVVFIFFLIFIKAK